MNVRAARLAVLVLLMSGCSVATGAQLSITSPTGGTHVTTESITVTGTAPGNTEITQDIPASPDQHTLSDAQGNWRMVVSLAVGDNVLTFRIADDETSDKQILVIRDVATAVATARSSLPATLTPASSLPSPSTSQESEVPRRSNKPTPTPRPTKDPLEGFSRYPGDPSILYRYLKGSEYSCYPYDRCQAMYVVPLYGCPSGLYVELNEVSNGVVVGFTNDTVGPVGAGQPARLIFPVIDRSTDQVQLTKISCY